MTTCHDLQGLVMKLITCRAKAGWAESRSEYLTSDCLVYATSGSPFTKPGPESWR